MRRRSRKDRGSRWLRWAYARWIQILAKGDLLGRDGRPSQSKLAAFTVLTTGSASALWQVFGSGLFALVRTPQGVTTVAGTIDAATVTVVVAGLSASFGIRTYAHFLDRARFETEAKQADVAVRASREILDRRVSKGDGADYEPTA